MLTAYDWPGNVRELKNVIERAVLLSDGVTLGERELPAEVRMPAAAPPESGDTLGAGRTLDDMERRLLEEALERAGGNQVHAAAALGISRRQLRTRMARYGLAGPRKPQGEGTA